MRILETCLQTMSSIEHYIQMMLSDTTYDPHLSTLNHLNKLLDMCKETLELEEIVKIKEEMRKKNELALEQHERHAGIVTASCDASVKENPGGPCACGVVFRFPDAVLQPYTLQKILPTAATNNQAEYDAVYEALVYFKTFGYGKFATSIQVRTDSKLVVDQVYEKKNVKDKVLKHKCNQVRELVAELSEKFGIPVELKWYPRNSTEDLRKANYAAQDCLGVNRH